MNPQKGKKFRLKIVIIALAAAVGIATYINSGFRGSRVEASVFGPAPTYTGAPLEANCTACHSSFPVNSGTGNVQITGLPRNYVPGQQIPVTVTVNQSDGVIYGFQMTTLDPLGRKTGSYILPTASPQPLQLDTGFVNGIERQYIEHTVNGTTPTQFGTKSWQFTWVAPSRRVGKIGLYAAGNAANSDGGSGGDYIYTTSASILSGTAIANFDGDQKSEISVYRPSNGVWYSIDSSSGNARIVQWGISGDIPAAGDYDGDGITDQAVFRPSNGTWYIILSSGGISINPFGINGDVPVPGDYDGDLKTDLALFRPSTGTWYIAKTTGGVAIYNWGLQTDLTAQADYDADGKTDVAVFRPSEGRWYILQSSDGLLIRQFGLTGDRPVQADYDGDGKADLAIFRPSTGQWWVEQTSSGVGVTQFGLSGDIAAPADYDGDGKTDIAVFRPSTGVWYAILSGNQTFLIRQWGLAGDTPVPAINLASQ
ncbi:MAG: choice-of-anchor V domain-containing protein [Pyrinomonadaceae bacterium]|jgi:hypothetical protein